VLDLLAPGAAARGGGLIAVFGSAGERDTTKRAPMGRVAAEAADLVIVTDEDPRLEDPRTINEQIADGARAAGARDGETLWVVDDRREAIAHAVSLARDGDVILLAGKGHEASIFYGTEKRPWDDRRVAREVLAASGWGSPE
jgi:UDP-N-acetylmuramoyl-L-alanyl-D-glutamate--2,6-diaminopimelate ligase